MNRKETLTLALLIAVMPPAWAVVSPYLGNSVGPVALICAGIYATNGNKFSNIIHMPSWLTGWAIGMLTMNLDKTTPVMSLTVQIAVAMLVGVYYVGALLDLVHRSLNK